MGGAKLEALGQVRDVLPYAVTQRFDATISVSGTGVTKSPLTYSGELPFDSGPDRNGRVFVVLSNVGIVIAPTTIGAQRFHGELLLRDSNGTGYHLASFASAFTADVSINNPIWIVLPWPFSAAKPNDLGTLEVNAAALSGGGPVSFRVSLNMGFYTDYESADCACQM